VNATPYFDRSDLSPLALDAYQANLDYLYGRLNYERSGMPRGTSELRLGRMRRLLRRLGDPHLALPIIHVAGTKGKGSTAALIAAGLSASGVRTGLFCSPHLHRLEERFRIDGIEASPDTLAALVDAVRPAVDASDTSDPHYSRRGATFFEVTTAMGLLHFARQDVGAVVLEVGMGGRLDSTNVVRPALSVLTTISLDHTRQLGSTLGAIASEKAGIIKRKGTVVSGVRGEDARDSIERTAQARSARLLELDADFSFRYHPPERPLTRPTPGFVSVRTWVRDWGTIELPLLGEHQGQNAAVALASFDALGELGVADVGPDAVTRGFARLTWPARVEVLGERPWLVVDGAHNVASARALADTLRGNFPTTRRTLVFGTTRDKDMVGQLEALLPLADVVVATRYVENSRAVEPDEVATATRNLIGDSKPIHQAGQPAEALRVARRLTPKDGLICVTGSLFLAAETRAHVLALDPSPTGGTPR